MTEQTSNDGTPKAADLTGEVEFIAAERLIFFSDAVVAIAITLLALTLTPPDLGPNATNQQVLSGLWAPDRRLQYLSFLISFVVIASHWRSHHRLFRYVSRLDSRIITLNLVWLLMIVIMPFASRTLSGNGGFGVRFALYSIVQVITMVSFLLMSRHIQQNALLRPGSPLPTRDAGYLPLLTAAVFFAISIPFAFVIGQWAFAFWIAAGPIARWLHRRLLERPRER